MNGHDSGPRARAAHGRRGGTVALALGLWVVCTVLGVWLIDLDSGPSLVSLPNDHGVSLIDAAGTALLLAGWSAAVLTPRRSASLPLPTPGRVASGAALVASCAGLVTAALLVPDFAGRKFVVAGLVLVVEGAAAATVLARPA